MSEQICRRIKQYLLLKTVVAFKLLYRHRLLRILSKLPQLRMCEAFDNSGTLIESLRNQYTLETYQNIQQIANHIPCYSLQYQVDALQKFLAEHNVNYSILYVYYEPVLLSNQPKHASRHNLAE